MLSSLRKYNVCSISLAFIVLFFVSRVALIDTSFPLVQHQDEKFVSIGAARIVSNKTLRYGYFNYPLFPTYITAISFVAAHFNPFASGQVETLADLGTDFYPTYRHPIYMVHARILFAFLATLAVASLAFVAYRTYCNSYLLLIVPLICASGELFPFHSWNYLNVDLVGTCFTVFVLYWSLTFSWYSDSTMKRCVVPGLLCAAAAASKYHFGLAVLPCILVLWLSRTSSKLSERIIEILRFSLHFAIGFFIFGFSIFLDVLSYGRGIKAEIKHYLIEGHTGFEGEPGVIQLVHHVSMLLMDYGYTLSFFGVVGLVISIQQNWKKSAVILSSPVATLVFFSFQRVNFQRNLLAVYLFFSVFIALGILESISTISRLLERLSNRDTT